jgi:hypothetical protein
MNNNRVYKTVYGKHGNVGLCNRPTQIEVIMSEQFPAQISNNKFNKNTTNGLWYS